MPVALASGASRRRRSEQRRRQRQHVGRRETPACRAGRSSRRAGRRRGVPPHGARGTDSRRRTRGARRPGAASRDRSRSARAATERRWRCCRTRPCDRRSDRHSRSTRANAAASTYGGPSRITSRKIRAIVRVVAAPVVERDADAAAVHEPQRQRRLRRDVSRAAVPRLRATIGSRGRARTETS